MSNFWLNLDGVLTDGKSNCIGAVSPYLVAQVSYLLEVIHLVNDFAFCNKVNVVSQAEGIAHSVKPEALPLFRLLFVGGNNKPALRENMLKEHIPRKRRVPFVATGILR